MTAGIVFEVFEVFEVLDADETVFDTQSGLRVLTIGLLTFMNVLDGVGGIVVVDAVDDDDDDDDGDDAVVVVVDNDDDNDDDADGCSAVHGRGELVAIDAVWIV